MKFNVKSSQKIKVGFNIKIQTVWNQILYHASKIKISFNLNIPQEFVQ